MATVVVATPARDRDFNSGLNCEFSTEPQMIELLELIALVVATLTVALAVEAEMAVVIEVVASVGAALFCIRSWYSRNSRCNSCSDTGGTSCGNGSGTMISCCCHPCRR